VNNLTANKVTSKDGTPIAYYRTGEGPAVILVTGALGTGTDPMHIELADLLAPHFTVYTYDRRGRGGSGDTPPYSVEREIEDIEALIEEAGGSASLYGISSGAVLALEAANKLPNKVKKVAMYEPPVITNSDTFPPLPEDYVEQQARAVAEGRRGDAVALFMKVVGVPEEYIAPMRQDPSWAGMENVAHTLPYDGIILRGISYGTPLAPNRWPAATMPVLLVAGGESERFFHDGAKEIAGQLPNAQVRTLEGQSHGVESPALTPVLDEFFAS
jgi:pimeloyl-ACP methyl ester carboxylesterase